MLSQFFLGAIASALLQGAPTVPPAPQLGPQQSYGDWHIACDNIASCEANALASDFQLEQGASLKIQRQAGRIGYFRVLVPVNDTRAERVRLIVDGDVLTEGEVDKDGHLIIPADKTMAIARALARGNEAQVVNTTPNAVDDVIARISLKGSAATLRRMDEEQGREGTKTAIVARGARRYSDSGQILPVVIQEAPAIFEALPGKKAMRRIARDTGCIDERPVSEDDDKYQEMAYPLAETEEDTIALVMIPCGFGAYNYSALPYIAKRAKGEDDDDADWRFAVAQFDYLPAWSEDRERPLLVNAFYSEQDGILGSYAKGRGLGDCGDGQSYVWNGAFFRLFEASAMNECRGVWQWPMVYRAYVQRHSLASAD